MRIHRNKNFDTASLPDWLVNINVWVMGPCFLEILSGSKKSRWSKHYFWRYYWLKNPVSDCLKSCLNMHIQRGSRWLFLSPMLVFIKEIKIVLPVIQEILLIKTFCNLLGWQSHWPIPFRKGSLSLHTKNQNNPVSNSEHNTN